MIRPRPESNREARKGTALKAVGVPLSHGGNYVNN